VKIQSVTTATRLVTLHVTARASVAPDPDPEAVVTTVTVEATEEGAQGQGPIHVAAAEIAAETTADTPDLAPAIATTTVVTAERTATVAPATQEVAAATEMIAEETLLKRREAPLATEGAPLNTPETLRSDHFISEKPLTALSLNFNQKYFS
jgi:hypothetical protein